MAGSRRRSAELALRAAALGFYIYLSYRGSAHANALLRRGTTDSATIEALDYDAKVLFAAYIADCAMAQCGHVVLWEWTARDVLWHHWPTIGALGLLFAFGGAGSTPARVAPEALAVGLLIHYNEALFVVCGAGPAARPAWVQRLHLVARNTVFPLLLAADALTYTRVMGGELCALRDGAGGSTARLLIVQFVLAMAFDHAKNYRAVLRLAWKMCCGQWRPRGLAEKGT